MERFTLGYADLEKQLIENFKSDFYEKMGYYPIVLTKDYKNCGETVFTLEHLEKYFIKFCPRNRLNKIISLRSRNREKETVEVRSIFMYFARALNYKLGDIGKYLNMHHSTVIHNLQTFGDRMQTSPTFREKFTEIFEHIKTNYQPNDYIPAMEYFDQVWHQSRPTILS